MPLGDISFRDSFIHHSPDSDMLVALLYLPCITYLSEWFIARRGLANGILFAGIFFRYHHLVLQLTLYSGTAAGGLLIPLPLLRGKYGLATTLQILGIVMALLVFPILPFIKGRLPQARL
ncbi:hypothetical protein K438DRAFT_1960086 [Mycena galopus ATCC 62051]|nr:hypothetical protein K438DRAFT_1960086 [Mycena galopus ATCC 62051]